MAAQGLHMAAQGLHMAAQGLHFAAEWLHFAAQGCIWRPCSKYAVYAGSGWAWLGSQDPDNLPI